MSAENSAVLTRVMPAVRGHINRLPDIAPWWVAVDLGNFVAQELPRPRPEATPPARRSLAKRRCARVSAIAKDVGAALDDMDALRQHVDARVW